MTPLEGFDYSAHDGAIVTNLVDAGAGFVCRYLADDWRGLFAPEYAALRAEKIPVVFIYEGRADRVLDGYEAGVFDAQFAQRWLDTIGGPSDAAVYFCVDFDEYPYQHPAIDAYLQGAASVLGLKRIGVYGGYDTMERCQASGAATFFWQTSAWEYGRGLHAGVHLYQYAYDVYLGGTNCDRTQALQENYGQDAYAGTAPNPQPESTGDPGYATPKLPDFYLKVNARKSPSSFVFAGDHWWPQRMNVAANHGTFTYSEPDVHAPYSGPPIAAGEKVAIEWAFEDEGGDVWLVNRSGFYPVSRFDPRVQVPQSRKKKAA